MHKLLLISMLVLVAFTVNDQNEKKKVVVKKGLAITNQIYRKVQKIIAQSYELNADHIDNNIQHIQSQLNRLYQSQWNVLINQIYSPQSRGFNVSDSNQWWMVGASINPKKQYWTYYIQKVSKQYSSQQQMHYVYNIQQFTYGPGISEQDRRVIENLMTFIVKQEDKQGRLEELKQQLTNYFGEGTWNIFNFQAFVGRTRFAARDQKYFVRNGAIDDYLVYLS